MFIDLMIISMKQYYKLILSGKSQYLIPQSD